MPYFHFRWLDEPITDKITTFLTPGEDDVHVFHRLFSPFSPLFCVSENGRYLKTAMLKGKTVTMLITNRVLGVHSDIVLVLVVPDLQINRDPLPLFLASYAMVQVQIQEELIEGWERILVLGLNMNHVTGPQK